MIQIIITVVGIAVGTVYALACVIQIFTIRETHAETHAYELVIQEEQKQIEHLERQEQREKELHTKQLQLIEEQLETERLKQREVKNIESSSLQYKVAQQSIRRDGLGVRSQTERGTYLLNSGKK